MQKSLYLIYVLILVLFQYVLQAQDLNCNEDSFEAEVYLNYGSVTNTLNSDYRSSLSIGQPVIGSMISPDNRSNFGFYNRFLLPPSGPKVEVSKGDFPDRIQVSWELDPLSPISSGDFKIYRDGAFLVSLANDIRQFIDFNVQAGEYYEYEVVGENNFGAGFPGSAVGFVNPNGVVSGRITTNNGNPVIGATVALTPTYGSSLQFDGVDDFICTPYNQAFDIDQFTISAWVKMETGNDQTGILDYGSDRGINWWLTTTSSSAGNGVAFNSGSTSANSQVSVVFDQNPMDWHHIATAFDGGNLTLYVDGEFIQSVPASMDQDSSLMSIGRLLSGTNYFNGKLDDIRILNRPLSQSEVQQSMLRTISNSNPDLVAYWKFDEGKGSKNFDISTNKIHGIIFDAEYVSDHPGVLNSGITDDGGFYTIEGIDYSQGGSFTATPSKNFYFNSALEFTATNESSARLTDFDVPDSSTIEVSFNAFDINTEQTILSKSTVSAQVFQLYIFDQKLYLKLEDQSKLISPITSGNHHLTLTFEQNNSSIDVTAYMSGTSIVSLNFTGVRDDWSGAEWMLGKNTIGPEAYFNGIIDEVAFFRNLLTQSEIQLHFTQGVAVADTNLLSFFTLNEGQGNDLFDYGPAMTGMGTATNTTWSTNVRNPEVVPHEFTPNSRQVNINTSNTAVGNIDFTDISTVAISGVVRYENTFCFAEGIEILVNGASYAPPIFTDVDGRFVADFEPGMDITLTPDFGDHSFLPAFFEIRNIANPVAGVLFQDLTKRTLSGQVAGGECRLSIIDTMNNARVIVKIASSENSCYEKTIEFTNADGNYIFENIPPIPLTVAIVEHSNPTINTAFQNAGGQSIDLREIQSDTVDFIYNAPPNVEILPFSTNACGAALLQQANQYQTEVKVYQDYVGGKCYLDSADIRIVNDIGDISQFDTLMKGGILEYQFTAGGPNILSPYMKKIEVTATISDGSSASAIQEGIVLGKKANQTTFASASPQTPIMILRDPPGDASSASIEEGSTTCTSWTMDITDSENSNVHLTYSYGPDVTTSLGLGAEVEFDIDATLDLGIETNVSYTSGTTNGIETCFTTTEVFSTSDGDLVVGDQGGDLFIGAAFNFLYGTTIDLLYDEDLCSINIDTNLTVFPDDFQTRFAFTEYHIRNVEIPRLIQNDSLQSANAWQAILDRNTAFKQQAVFEENFSFDAGAVFEKSLTTEITESTSFTYEVENSAQIALDLGLLVNGVGLVGGFAMELTQGTSREQANSNLKTRSISYTLADDDIGDNFTVNIKKDRHYGTPVFDLVSGKTMCPYETNTLNREEVSIAIDKNNAINVGSNEAAVFTLTVGNLSDEFKVYTVTHVPESNPFGAIVKINGKQSAQDLEIDAGSTLDLTLTVERGPVAYSYEDLGVAIFSACEDDRADFLGSDIDPRFYQELAFNVQFIEPCSEVDISFPLQDWVVTPDDDTLLNISISEYDLTDEDLELVRVQYRKIGGDGAWINITEILKAELGPVFENIVWDMSLLDDGPYEIRVLTQCFSGSLAPGISSVIQGRLETRPPMIFGTPQPADGILAADDEISVTFNEFIDCDEIFPADQNGNNNIGLYDATSGALIDATISCTDGKLIVVPNIQNKFIENRTLRVELDQIPDLSGNVTGHLQWEFFVNRNPLEWIGPDIDELMTVLQPITVTRQIINNGGVTASFSINDVPTWVSVEPNHININPGEIIEINFTFQEDLLIGDYQQEVVLSGTEGDEILDVRLMVRCEAPDWTFTDQASFENTMNFALELDILGTPSEDISDMVSAYINGELRGVANVAYVEEVNKYMAFLTVYNDNVGDPIEFKVFDGDECLIYTEILEEYDYVPSGLVGSPLFPEVIHVVNIIEREITLAEGWNWISVNIDQGDNSLTSVMSTLRNPEGALIKDNQRFAQNLGNQWFGNLEEITYQPRYLLKSSVQDTLDLVGAPYELANAPIDIIEGWNWVGFVAQQGMSIEVALSSLNPLNGDIIKSQTAFAQYVAGSGWVGNLNFLEPGKGYLLNISNPGILVFPEPESSYKESFEKSHAIEPLWTSNPYQYEASMSLIATLSDDSKVQLTEHDELGVFIGDELRGTARPIFIDHKDAQYFFINIFGSEDIETLTFQYYDEEHKMRYNATNELTFKLDNVSGTIASPVEIHLADEGTYIKLSTNPEEANLEKHALVVDVLNNIPDQNINQGEAFSAIDLAFFLEETTCSAFDFKYIIGTGNDVPPSNCDIANFEYSMTAFVKIIFDDSLAFFNTGDHITLYNESSEVVACSYSSEDPFNVGEQLYFLNVSGETEDYSIHMDFYSAHYNRIFRVDSVLTYAQNATLGLPNAPIMIDVAPVVGQFEGTQFNLLIRDNTWLGSQAIQFEASECSNLEIGIDTAIYTINEFGAPCALPIILDIEVTQPTSNSCVLSNPNGQIYINALLADSFSIDNGVSFQDHPEFSGLTDGLYNIVVKNNPTCIVHDQVMLDNNAYASIMTIDTSVNCIDRPGILLTAETLVGEGPVDFVWKNEQGQVIDRMVEVGKGKYFVTATDSRSCMASDSLEIFEEGDPLTWVLPDFLTGPSRICQEETGVLFTTSIEGSFGVFNWNFESQGSTITELSGGADASIDFDATAQSAYVKVQVQNLCSSIADSLMVSINDLNVETEAITTDCFDDYEATLTATPQNGNAPYSLEWRNAQGTIIDASVPVHEGSFTVVVSDGDNCSVSDVLEVVPLEDPLASISGTLFFGPETVCPAISVPFVSSYPATIGTITWSAADPEIIIEPSNNGQNAQIIFDETVASTTIYMTITNACSSRTDSIIVNLADPQICQGASDCANLIEVTNEDLNAALYDARHQASKVLTINAQINGLLGFPIHNQYEFLSGRVVDVMTEFEIQKGTEMNISIEDCQND